jgi:hypothetical protein
MIVIVTLRRFRLSRLSDIGATSPRANRTVPQNRYRLAPVSVAVSVTAAKTGHIVSGRVVRSRPQHIEGARTSQKTKS